MTDKTVFQRLIGEEYAGEILTRLNELEGEMDEDRELHMQFAPDDVRPMIEELEELTDGR